MKKIFFTLALVAGTSAAFAQDKQIVPAEKGVVYGTAAKGKTTIVSADELEAKMQGEAFSGRITGKVTEVCQAMGCWFKLQKADGTTLMVKTKDHGFFLPQNLVGKVVAVDGTATIKEVTEAQRRHLAADGGKSKEEIEQIKGSEKQMQVIAAGVQVLN